MQPMSKEALAHALANMKGVDGNPGVSDPRITPRAAKRGDKALRMTLTIGANGGTDVPIFYRNESASAIVAAFNAGVMVAPTATDYDGLWLPFVADNPIELAGMLVVAPSAALLQGIVVKTRRKTPFEDVTTATLEASSYIRSNQYQVDRVELPIVSELDGWSHLLLTCPANGITAYNVSLTFFIRNRSEIRDRLQIGEAPAMERVGGAR